MWITHLTCTISTSNTKCLQIFGDTGVALLGASTDMNEARSLSYRRDIVDIYSNSWGRRRDGGPETLTQKTLESGVEKVGMQWLFFTTISVIHMDNLVQHPQA